MDVMDVTAINNKPSADCILDCLRNMCVLLFQRTMNKNRNTGIFVGVFFCLIFWVVQLFAADVTQTEPHQFLAAIPKIADIQSPGSTPFLMLARVHLQQDAKSVDGVYAVAWAAPDRFRRVMKFPNFEETEVVVGDKVYRKRSIQSIPFLVWQFDTMMQFVHRMRLDDPTGERFDDPSTKIRKIESRQSNGSSDVCITMALGRVGVGKLCADPLTHTPLTLETGYDARDMSPTLEHYEFSEYQPFEGKLFPRAYRFRSLYSQVVEVRVEKLIATKTFDADEFTPPIGSEPFPFCDAPVGEGEFRPNFGNVAFGPGFKDFAVAMYFKVNDKGGVQNAEVVHSDDPLKNRELLKSFVGTHFPIERCAGVPMPYEIVIQMLSRH
jgi:hypothetical protein